MDDGAITLSEWEVENGEEGTQSVIVEGDLDIGSVEVALEHHREIAEALADGVGSRLEELTMNVRRVRTWSGPIRYKFHKSLALASDPTSEPLVKRELRERVQNVIASWNREHAKSSGLRWEYDQTLKNRPRSKGVLIVAPNNDVCRAGIGEPVWPRGLRELRLGILGSCSASESVIMHEMGHIMGARHEQQRHDRDRHIVFLPRNSADTRGNSARKSNTKSYRSIGSYDTESLMHYSSSIFSIDGTAPYRPTHLNRHEIDRLGLFGGLRRRTHGYNRQVRLGRSGIDLDAVRVMDVDGDGLDDLVVHDGPEFLWSRSGASGWIPLHRVVPREPFGTLESAVAGDFTGDGAIDFLAALDETFTFFRGGGGGETIVRAAGAIQLHAEDIDGDGLRDVFILQRDGSWAMARGGDVMGELVPLSSGPMGATEVKLVRLQGTAGPVHVVGVVGGRLVHVNLTEVLDQPSNAQWQNVFSTPRGPFRWLTPPLSKLWFIHIARDAGPDEPIDLLTPSAPHDGSGARPRTPTFVNNVLGSSASRTREIAAGSGVYVGVDLADGVAVGHFAHLDPDGLRLRGSILNYGRIFPSAPAVSDVLGIGTRYANWSETRLSDRYPLSETRDIITNYHANVQIGERIELEAAFMSAKGLGSVYWRVERRNWRESGSAWIEQEYEEVPLSGKRDSVHRTFVARTTGSYRVTAAPLGGPLRERATWLFDTDGAHCGNGRVGEDEECDWGELNSDTEPNTCRLDCTLPRCGDGVVDAQETCDAGPLNSDSDPDAPCRENCALLSCGNGVVDQGEQCDDGAANSDTLPGACRTACVLAFCGDGVVEAEESCDDGFANSDLSPDACRTDCTLPYCGDGVADTGAGEQCDSGIDCAADCTCGTNCFPFAPNGCFCAPL